MPNCCIGRVLPCHDKIHAFSAWTTKSKFSFAYCSFLQFFLFEPIFCSESVSLVLEEFFRSNERLYSKLKAILMMSSHLQTIHSVWITGRLIIRKKRLDSPKSNVCPQIQSLPSNPCGSVARRRSGVWITLLYSPV